MTESLRLARVTAVSWQSVTAGVCLACASIVFDRDIVDVGILLVGVALCLVVAHLRRHIEVPKAPFERRELTVRRVERLSHAFAALDSKSKGLLLISGASGTGKTVLTEQLADELTKRTGSLRVIRQVDYGFFQADRLREEIGELHHIDRALVVLDQLEKLFLLPEPAAAYHKQVLGEVIKAVRSSPNWKCVLVVRREFFLDLATLETLRPLLGSVLIFGGFDSVVEGEAFVRFRNRLVDEVGGDLHLAARVLEDASLNRRRAVTPGAASEGALDPERLEVLPVEAVAVAEALRYTREALGRELSVRSYENEGGLRGAMRVFFEALLDRCGDRADGTRILSVLSNEPRARRALSSEEIGLITGVPLERVDQLVCFFERAGLLQRVGSKVDWVHDFFAERFNDLGGVFLDPAERDNIGHFSERLAADGKDALTPQATQSILARRYTWGLFFIAVALLSGRLLSLPFVRRFAESESIWVQAPIHIFSNLPGRLVDWSFLPTAVSLIAWSWYTTALHRRVFARLGEPRPAAVLTFLVTGLSTLLVLLSIVFPRLWIALTGIGGLAVGMKYLQIAQQFGSGWMRTELFFGRAGKTTCINCCITFLLGLAFALFLSRGASRLSDSMIAGVLAASGAILLYFAYVVVSLHISHERVPLLVGIYRRYCKS